MLFQSNKKSSYYKDIGQRTGKTYLCIDDEDWHDDPNFEPDTCPFCYEKSCIIDQCLNCDGVHVIGRWIKEI